ncbi:MAG: tetratricopeptide repeat protein [Desulfuromonadaceae bacterium]|nr:tetratricopeptide repeat protein [Desulfuromonadaceae bacterium]MDD5104857.1 tetratricopeptide repeat protein [Desulfuromonadaceae bacterium]
MAIVSKKDKLLEDAQKLVARGQFDKAARIYEQIIALDPTTTNLRQKRAELLIKCGQHDEARQEFETIGKHFTNNGFYQKAIAVYKQLQKHFPHDLTLTLTLAELNAKHGLVANSLSEYKRVYEFYEKEGSASAALNILVRMQDVDPQNIPIKLKLADVLFQQGKANEAYTTFSKTASLVLERGDNATLATIITRIQQLFPDKSDVLLGILSEQVNQGNAASAIDKIQNLLRSDPTNKQAWDLIVLAYQRLEQPQRVKVAYQHYLKFFPSEPSAIVGLIASVTADKDLAGAIELLDQYETLLISAGCLQQLEQTYRELDSIDPVNGRVLEGLIRIASAAGNNDEVCSLTSKLHGLRAADGSGFTRTVEPEPASDQEESVLFETALPQEQTATSVAVAIEHEDSSAPEPAEELPEPVADSIDFPVEEFEIDMDIDIDIDIDFDNDVDGDLDHPDKSPDQETGTASSPADWLDSVGDLFDSINTAPRGVKFGNESEQSDAQSHFDLGQAFKEMGLYDEAINEFRQASLDQSRRVECLILQCACLRERGDSDKAITMLKALLQPGLSDEEGCAVRYELASGYEAVGDKEAARALLNEINAINPSFRDVSSRFDAAGHPESIVFSDEDLDDFSL